MLSPHVPQVSRSTDREEVLVKVPGAQQLRGRMGKSQKEEEGESQTAEEKSFEEYYFLNCFIGQENNLKSHVSVSKQQKNSEVAYKTTHPYKLKVASIIV